MLSSATSRTGGLDLADSEWRVFWHVEAWYVCTDMIRRLVPFVAACAALVGLIAVAGTFEHGTASAGSPTPFRCPGAQFSFPVDGSMGWIYREPASIETSGGVHSGLDVWASGGDGSPVYALADGVVSRTTNSSSFDIVYTNSGVESYMTHLRHDLAVNDTVTAGEVIAETDGAWVHLSLGAQPGYDDRVVEDTQDPSPYFAANLNYDSGARNPLPYDRPLSIWCAADDGDVQTGNSLCDDRFDSIDALVVLQYSAGLVRSPPCSERADVNGDGSVDAVDASLILQHAAGILPELPLLGGSSPSGDGGLDRAVQAVRETVSALRNFMGLSAVAR